MTVQVDTKMKQEEDRRRILQRFAVSDQAVKQGTNGAEAASFRPRSSLQAVLAPVCLP